MMGARFVISFTSPELALCSARFSSSLPALSSAALSSAFSSSDALSSADALSSSA
jgi:hypothetical protein